MAGFELLVLVAFATMNLCGLLSGLLARRSVIAVGDGVRLGLTRGPIGLAILALRRPSGELAPAGMPRPITDLDSNVGVRSMPGLPNSPRHRTRPTNRQGVSRLRAAWLPPVEADDSDSTVRPPDGEVSPSWSWTVQAT